MQYRLFLMFFIIIAISQFTIAQTGTKQSNKPSTEKESGLRNLFKKKETVEEAEPKSTKKRQDDELDEDETLDQSYKNAKADVRAAKKERKAAEAKEDAARARAEVIRAQRRVKSAEAEVVKKDEKAQKARTKAEEKKGKNE